MHGLLATTGGGIPDPDDPDSVTTTADMPSLDDLTDDEWHDYCLHEESDSDDEPGLITMMNMMSPSFREGSRAWDPSVDGIIFPTQSTTPVGDNPDGVGSSLGGQFKAVSGKRQAPASKKPVK